MSTLFHWSLPVQFMPHGHCYLWLPDILWLHVGSDALIAGSYYAIPIALAYFVRERRAVLPYWWVPALFATFIFLCGTTHVMNIWTVWNPDYRVDGLLKLATGIASAATAIVVFGAMPQALALRTPIELQAEVDARTAELTAVNTRLLEEVEAHKRTTSTLRETIQRLADTDRRKDEFLATLAHELRNPLAPIANGVQIMRMTLTDGKLRRTTDMMDRQVRHLVRLVDDLLDISRITRGKAVVRMETLALQEVITGALESSWTAADSNRLGLDVEMPEEPLRVEGDLDRLTQVFSNIISNAAKYTPEGGKVNVRLFREGTDVVVSVKDSGVGIPPESLDLVFEMFSQLRSNTHGEPGLGIGLALVRQLVRLHGGTVEARSEGAGRGSEFIVRLPAKDSPAQPTGAKVSTSSARATDATGTDSAAGRADAAGADSPADATPADSGRSPNTRPRRVLVVDDNRDAADTLTALLELEGHEVRQASDGLEAVEAVRNFRPSIVFMDLGMPRMGGLEATRRIREMPQLEQPLIVALTGWGQDSDRDRSLRTGMDFHLIKPIDPGALRQLMALRG